ncbi:MULTISPECIES: sugar transferase [Chryseobacterium]|uniref:Colanic biosynthesis UDP-glucose lipid carrier transferase n=1 Tax=Chryseobacterium balustinum TaxID=246 RepID=A0AAX2ISQ2_9FLAO|nr:MULTISPECIES: sugar transferase [Chryseobacterium]AZB28246.1 sugar transferase [Chryseobacterium balustinum]MCD0457550.1 sugar transferase [Chryseobacterium sp. LC2016-27]SKB90238.1 Sugar transferase involved in LPS biosynthesis (colanic, teichoic acid) [Chryseobacterium balustinum]SQA92322.1 Putative colanic biosynthesis UDP-glucose lipid carrier transferase [Chryseobacterium balustinum]
MYKKIIKRFFDFTVALFALLILSPVFIIVTIGLYFANQGKPFFFQRRPGKNEKIFSIIKFKTMNDKKDAHGDLLSDAERLTPIGAFVRKTSLDELPQLINVLKGEMSLIGPRPLLEKYLPYYTEREKERHSLSPGITGWAQLKGRNTLGWDDRLLYDLEYVQKVSLKFDLKIILLTFKKVFKSEDIVVDPRSIMKDLDEERKHN